MMVINKLPALEVQFRHFAPTRQIVLLWGIESFALRRCNGRLTSLTYNSPHGGVFGRAVLYGGTFYLRGSAGRLQ